MAGSGRLKLRIKSFSLMVFVVMVSGAFAQEGPLRDEEAPIPVDEIIAAFSAKEGEFAEARNNYVFRMDVRVEELDPRDRVIGEYRMTSEIGFEPDGIRRTEEVLYAPPPTLRASLTRNDIEAMTQPFVLIPQNLPLYDVEYVGKQQIDEIDNYVFDVSPKVMEEGELYFEGRVWVDDLELQIVKTYGKSVPERQGPDVRPENEDLFLPFETYRQPVDGYWFPAYVRGLDTLDFSGGPIRLRQVVRYDNYRKFEADVRLTFGDEVEPESDTDDPGETESPDN